MARLEEARLVAIERRVGLRLGLGEHDTLADDLGLEPGPELQLMERDILAPNSVVTSARKPVSNSSVPYLAARDSAAAAEIPWPLVMRGRVAFPL